jgi:hypothetical protein
MTKRKRKVCTNCGRLMGFEEDLPRPVPGATNALKGSRRTRWCWKAVGLPHTCRGPKTHGTAPLEAGARGP